MILNCWMSWKGCGIVGNRVRARVLGLAPALGTGSSGRGDRREEDRVGVGGGDVVRRGTAEAGAGDVWVGGGGNAVVWGSEDFRAGMGNAGGRDSAGGAGGNAG